MWDKEIPPEDQKNSSEMRLCRISDEIIQVRGWNFLVAYQYFFSPTLWFSESPTNLPGAKTGVNRFKYQKNEEKWHFKLWVCFYSSLKNKLLLTKTSCSKQRHKNTHFRDVKSVNVWNVTGCQDYRMYSNKCHRVLQFISPKMNLNSKQNMGSIPNSNVWKLFCITFFATFR